MGIAAEGGYHWIFRESGGLKPKVVPDGKVRCGEQVGRVKLPEAFRFEAEFYPDVDWASAEQKSAMSARENVLFDNLLVPIRNPKYNHGLYVSLKSRGNTWTPRAYFGFGDDVLSATGPKLRAEPGKSIRFAFTFNAAGKVKWETNGKTKTSLLGRGGTVADSTRIASVGERACSLYRSFWGTVLEVSITPTPREWVSAAIVGRSTFVRGETNATLTVKLDDFKSALSEVRTLPIETRLLPGPQQRPLQYGGCELNIEYSIVPMANTEFPIVAWGCDDWAHARELGFTEIYDNSLGSVQPRTVSGPSATFHQRLDDAARLGLKLLGNGRLGLYSDDQVDDEHRRLSRQPGAAAQKREPEVSSPYFADLARRTAIGNAEDYGSHPAFAGLCANSERVDDAYPSFNHEQELYLKETGAAVPAEVQDRFGSLKSTLKRYPDGIVSDDDAVLKYYRWWWRDGNGWPRVNSAIAEAYRTVCKQPGFFSFFDPAVRCPPGWGSGGSVDVLSQWVYANPEPLSVAGPCEEVLAMIKGRPGQQPMIMTQLICYRSRLAPTWAKLKVPPVWAQKFPQAAFVTIPPDAFEEATWTMLSKPVKGIMYHGWGTIADTGDQRGYCFTNPETTERVRTTLKEVVAPLGPTLAKLGRSEIEVAILESFTTAALGGPKGMGWSMPAYTLLERAHLDARIVFEEELLRDGLPGIKVLYLPQCRLLTPSVISKLREFKAGGGIIVADGETNAAIPADVKVGVQRFASIPKSDHREDMEAISQWSNRASELTRRAKTEMLAEAAKLRQQLSQWYQPRYEASSPEIIVHSRNWGTTPYLFAINDHRDFGNYVGPWGLMMERGLPQTGEVLFNDRTQQVQAIYELGHGGEVKFSRAGDRIRVPVSFSTTDGRLLALLKKPIDQLRIESPLEIAPGDSFTVKVSILDAAQQPIDAILPVEVRLYNAAGSELDGGGWLAAPAGQVSVTFLTNLDDPQGNYRLVARDRASGKTQSLTISTHR